MIRNKDQLIGGRFESDIAQLEHSRHWNHRSKDRSEVSKLMFFLDRIDFLLLRGVLFATSCHGFEKRVLHKLIFHETNLQSLTMHVDLCCGSEVRLSLFRRAIQTSVLPFFNEMPEYRSLALIGRQFITYSRNMTTHFITSHCHAALSIRSSN